MNNRLHILLVLLVGLLSGPYALAYDFVEPNHQGKSIYYNITEANNVEVAPENHFLPTLTYSESLVIPENVRHNNIEFKVTGIADRAFQYCGALTDIQLPDGIEYIGDFAFAGCISLDKAIMLSSVSRLGINIFDGCFNLKEIGIAKGGQYTSLAGMLYDVDLKCLVLAPQGFDECVILSPNTSDIADRAFYGCTFLQRITIPDGLRRIGDHAFFFCGSLNNISIPASVVDIGREAFGMCSSLTSIDVDPANPCYSSIDGALYDIEKSKILQAPCLFFPESPLPETIKEIGELAFAYNSALTDIILPEGVETIGQGAFLSCTDAKTLTLPSSIQNISPMSFALCDSIQSIYLSAHSSETIEVADDAFVSISEFQPTVYVPKGTRENYSKAPVWRDFKNIVEYDGLIPQSISWNTENDVYSPDSLTITLSAVSTSGLDIEYAISPECRGAAEINGNIVNVIRGGEITVIASQHGNDVFSPAHPVRKTINSPVNGIQDIDGDDIIKVYSTHGNIVVQASDKDAIVEVYDISGILVYSGKARRIPVSPRHVYMVRVGNETFKILSI